MIKSLSLSETRFKKLKIFYNFLIQTDNTPKKMSYKIEFMEEIAAGPSADSKDKLFIALQKQSNAYLLDLAVKTTSSALYEEYIKPLISARGLTIM